MQPTIPGQTWAEGVRRLVEEDFPQAQRITLVMDNLSTHTGASLYKTFEPAKARALLDKLEFVYTPNHGSWLNIAECELSVLARQCLDRRIPDIDSLPSTEVDDLVPDRAITGASGHSAVALHDRRCRAPSCVIYTASG